MSIDLEKINQVNDAITHLMKNCLNDFSKTEMREVEIRHRILNKQYKFWLSQKNYDRFTYDMTDFGNWLCDYIAIVSERKNS